MEYVIGALLLASFFGLAVYAVRGGNLMIGMLIIGTLWTVLPLFGNTFATNPDFIAAYPGVTDISFVDAITKVYQSGPEGWGSVLVNVVFGAWFGRVLLETGIADALIRKTVELGGDKPIVISVLLSIVTTAIFSTLFGAGAVVAIGVIILPILMSLGIPKVLAVGSFMMSVGAGMYLNPVLSGQFLAFFLDENGKQLITYDDPARLRWAVIGMLVQGGLGQIAEAARAHRKHHADICDDHAKHDEHHKEGVLVDQTHQREFLLTQIDVLIGQRHDIGTGQAIHALVQHIEQKYIIVSAHTDAEAAAFIAEHRAQLVILVVKDGTLGLIGVGVAGVHIAAAHSRQTVVKGVGVFDI